MVEATESPGTPTHDVILDGTESLQLRAIPRERDPDDIDIPFWALGVRGSFDLFPIDIDFLGTESADLVVTDTEGTVWNLTLDFTVDNFNIGSGAANITAGLSDIAAYLDGVVQAAEAAAGVPNATPLFEPVEVRRIKQDGLDFGALDINFRLRSGPDRSRRGRPQASPGSIR